MNNTTETTLDLASAFPAYPVFAAPLPADTPLTQEDDEKYIESLQSQEQPTAQHDDDDEGSAQLLDEVPLDGRLIYDLEGGYEATETNGPGPRPVGQVHNYLLWKTATVPGRSGQFSHLLANFSARIVASGRTESGQSYLTLRIINNAGEQFLYDVLTDHFYNGEMFEALVEQVEGANLRISKGRGLETAHAIKEMTLRDTFNFIAEQHRIVDAHTDFIQEIIDGIPVFSTDNQE